MSKELKNKLRDLRDELGEEKKLMSELKRDVNESDDKGGEIRSCATAISDLEKEIDDLKAKIPGKKEKA